MLPGCQQERPPVPGNDEPVIEAHTVVVDELYASFLNTISTGLWKPWEWINNLARVINFSLVSKTLPFETAGA